MLLSARTVAGEALLEDKLHPATLKTAPTKTELERAKTVAREVPSIAIPTDERDTRALTKELLPGLEKRRPAAVSALAASDAPPEPKREMSYAVEAAGMARCKFAAYVTAKVEMDAPAPINDT